MMTLLLFSFWWRSNYSKWLRVVVCPPRGLSITSSPLAPLTILYAYCRIHPPIPRHRVSAAITFRITSQWEVNFPAGHLSEPITAGGQDEVKWHDLWDRWKRRGHKCIANLWEIWIKAWELGDMTHSQSTEVPLNQLRPSVQSDYVMQLQ